MAEALAITWQQEKEPPPQDPELTAQEVQIAKWVDGFDLQGILKKKGQDLTSVLALAVLATGRATTPFQQRLVTRLLDERVSSGAHGAAQLQRAQDAHEALGGPILKLTFPEAPEQAWVDRLKHYGFKFDGAKTWWAYETPHTRAIHREFEEDILNGQ